MNIITTFETAETMTQVFSKRVKLIVDFNHLIIVVLIDKEIADKISFEENFTMFDFMKLQRSIAEQAQKLEEFNNENK